MKLSFFAALLRSVIIALQLSLIASFAQAQCTCDHVINPPSDPTISLFVNGEKLGVKPGQTICLNAGFYKQIRFEKLVGAPGRPITIQNCGGLVEVGGTYYGTWYAMDIITSKYVRLTGSGNAAFKYGIKLAKSGDTGLKIGALSTDVEVDHLEIGNTEFAGIMAKTDFAGNPPPDAPDMNNINIHDNYIHDTWGEGMYIGETRTPGQNFRHLRIWNNVVTRTGLDLIQVANSLEDVHVFNNVFYRGGTRNVLYQNKGLQIGDNSVGRYYNNFIIETPSNSMIIMGSGNIHAFNNYLETSGNPAFFIDNRTVTVPDAPINVSGNFIMEVAETAAFFSVFNEINPINIAENQLEGNNEMLLLGSNAGPNVLVSGNLRTDVIGRVQFTDAANDDFTLQPESLYQDMGLLDQAEVDAMNKQPFIDLIADQQVQYGTTRQLTVSAHDPDADVLSLEAFNLPPFVTFSDNGGGKGVFTIAPGLNDLGVYYKVRVRVTDSDGAMNSQYFTLNVIDSFKFIATASSTDGEFYPENTLDGNFTTRWAAKAASSEWIKYDMKEEKVITDVKIAFFNGDSARYSFRIEVSSDDVNWTDVYDGENSGTTEDFETFSFAETRGRYLRITDTGDGVNSYKEVDVLSPISSQVYKFYPTDDIYVEANTLYNTAVLKTNTSKRTAYIRCEVSGLNVGSAAVVSAVLKLTAVETQSGTLETSLGSHSNWSESTVRKSQLPSPSVLVNSLNTNFTTGETYSVDVTSAIVDNGIYSFILVLKNSQVGVAFSSKEGQFVPELEIQTSTGALRKENSTARSTKNVAVSSVTVSSESSSENITLYPNPATETLTLDLGPEVSGFVTVEICDQAGKCFFQKRWTDPKRLVHLDISSLNIHAGSYFIKVKQGVKPIKTFKFIKR